MNSKRFNLFFIGVTAFLGILIIVAVFGASTLLKQRSKKLLDLKLESKVLDQQLASLAAAKKDISKYNELNREAKIIVPQDKDQAQAVREITGLASKNKITISSILFPDSNLGLKPTTSASSTSGTETPTPG